MFRPSPSDGPPWDKFHDFLSINQSPSPLSNFPVSKAANALPACQSAARLRSNLAFPIMSRARHAAMISCSSGTHRSSRKPRRSNSVYGCDSYLVCGLPPSKASPRSTTTASSRLSRVHSRAGVARETAASICASI